MNSTPTGSITSTRNPPGGLATPGDALRAAAESALFEVRSSPIHGRGAFARGAIGFGTRVAEYVGERITKSESLLRCEANNEYIFDLDDQFDLDGSVEWNVARFINHSCAPNCEATWQQGHIYITAIRDIAPGDELSFNYGYDLTDYREHPCRCGSPDCVGFMVAEEFFAGLRRTATNAGAQG